MRKLLIVPMMVLTASVAFGEQIFLRTPNEKVTPTALANAKTTDAKEAARQFLKSKVAKLGAGGEDFVAKQTTEDNLGQVHYKYQQTINGIPVFNGEMIVHVDKATGNSILINGEFAKARPELTRGVLMMDGKAALIKAADQAKIKNWSAQTDPQMMYVVNGKGRLYLTWMTKAAYVDRDGDQLDLLFADVATGDLVMKASLYPRAKSRATYTANNGTALPGTLKRSEGGAATGDSALDAAHDYAGNVYDYYKNVHGRDSYDNAGAQIKSSVHYNVSYNNAFWNGTQMVYGDGDGTQFIPLSKALDVDAHELTHAVTERTANLTYSNESGALNEANSDIFGNTCEAYTRNAGVPDANTWKVGEDIYTPGTAGDALRYMNDPAAAGDYDYYPTRYTGTADNGGVHSNSGIANLAYYLMVMGGTHPRGKTTVNVTPLSPTPATSLTMASKIWYRALTVYWTSSTGFAGARTGTVTAANDLYPGGAAAATVTAAWDAVGAPGGGGGGGGTTTTLTNGTAVTGISAATGAWVQFKIVVPASQTQLQIVMSGGTGDADMYVKLNAQPTSTVYDYRPYLSGNAETVTVTNPAAGTWYIGLNAYAAFSGVTLKATYSGGTGSTCTTYTGSFTAAGQNAYKPTTSGYASAASGTHKANLSGPAGADFDLYLQKLSGTTWTQVGASEGSTATEAITYSGTAGTYRWRIYSYAGTGSYTLCESHPN